MSEQNSRLMISAIVMRSEELTQVSRDMRKFVKAMKKEIGDDIDFDIQVGINPHGHGIDQRPETPKVIGFRLPHEYVEATFDDEGDELDDGGQEESEGDA